jgi:glycosyltransferase involved in cell wall biosynthesis
MTESPQLLSIVIPHRNDPFRLARCLAALAPQRDGGVEVIVVDDGSDGVPETPSWVRLIRQAQAGAGPARNRGVAAAKGEVIAFVDADCVPAPGFAARARLARRVTGGRIEMFDELPKKGTGARTTGSSRTGPQAFEAALAFDQARSVRRGWAATANFVVPRAVFQIVGPFRAGLAEDVDWCRRAGKLGHPPVFDAALVVGHPTRADWPMLSAKWRRLTDEGFALARERPLGRLRWALRMPLVCGAAAADLHRIACCPALSPSERLRASGVMTRVRALRVCRMLAQLAHTARNHRPVATAPLQHLAAIRSG